MSTCAFRLRRHACRRLSSASVLALVLELELDLLTAHRADCLRSPPSQSSDAPPSSATTTTTTACSSCSSCSSCRPSRLLLFLSLLSLALLLPFLRSLPVAVAGAVPFLLSSRLFAPDPSRWSRRIAARVRVPSAAPSLRAGGPPRPPDPGVPRAGRSRPHPAWTPPLSNGSSGPIRRSFGPKCCAGEGRRRTAPRSPSPSPLDDGRRPCPRSC